LRFPSPRAERTLVAGTCGGGGTPADEMDGRRAGPSAQIQDRNHIRAYHAWYGITWSTRTG
jgi:hypothetical protein